MTVDPYSITAPAETVDQAYPLLRRSTTNLVLTGVLASDNPAEGLAIIRRSAESSGTYPVGATLGPGVTLHAVFADGVILERDGVLEALVLPQAQAALPRASGLSGITAARATTLADAVRPVPVFANGVQRGYRFYPASDAQRFAALGLQPGDFVVSINGIALDDPQRSMATFNSIVSALGASVRIERHGKTYDLTLGAPLNSLSDVSTPVLSTTP
jgi:general secretion pathway protein C